MFASVPLCPEPVADRRLCRAVQVSQLKLEDQLRWKKHGEDSVSGYFYYPDRLVGIPDFSTVSLNNPIKAVKFLWRLLHTLEEPLFRGFFPSAFNALRTMDNQYATDMAKGNKDMSIGDYYAYRFGRPDIVDNVMSAVIHGITGGDVWKTSMTSGPLAGALVTKDENQTINEAQVQHSDHQFMKYILREDTRMQTGVHDLAEKHLDSTSLWFQNGFSTLTNAIAKDLGKHKNFTIKTGTPVESVRYSGTQDRILVSLTPSPPQQQPTPLLTSPRSPPSEPPPPSPTKK